MTDQLQTGPTPAGVQQNLVGVRLCRSSVSSYRGISLQVPLAAYVQPLPTISIILMLQIEVLKSLELIPRTPSPTPLEERPVEELSTAELAELVGR